MNPESIFLVATIQLNKDGSWRNVHTWYYFFTLEEAFDAVYNNDWDIYEDGNEYVVIEEHLPGATIGAKDIYWFRWDAPRQQYLPTPEPEFAKLTVNWTIG
jgi:hypothetical protein